MNLIQQMLAILSYSKSLCQDCCQDQRKKGSVSVLRDCPGELEMGREKEGEMKGEERRERRGP